MKFAASLSALAAVLSAAGAVATDIPIAVTLIQGAVLAVQQTAQPGPDKLAAVLMHAETVLPTIAPKIGTDMEKVLTVTGQFVNALVADYHAAKIFVHTTEQAVESAAHKLGIG